MTSAHIPHGERFEEGHVLTLDFECLKSIPAGINEVRVWHSELLGCDQVGKRMDISSLEDNVLQEAHTLMAIDHRNVVPVRTAAFVSGYPAPMQVIEIVTPYYTRGSITDALLRGEEFGCRRAIAIGQGILRGLGELQEGHGIIHRDMKSGNVLLTDDGSVARVADLGLAGLMDAAGQVQALHNPTLYTPPEHFATGQLSRSSDLYPVGLILRELIGGAFPYEEYTTTSIAERLARHVSPLSMADRKLPIWTPRDLRRVIRKALRSEPSERYQTAREMDQALSRAVVVDWRQVDDMRWEAPCLHDAGCAVRVDARKVRGGDIRMTVSRYRTAWRRALPVTTVATLESTEAARAFDSATSIAAAR